MNRQFERLEQEIIDSHERGEISAEECSEELRELQLDFQQEVKDRAESAYETVMSDYGLGF